MKTKSNWIILTTQNWKEAEGKELALRLPDGTIMDYPKKMRCSKRMALVETFNAITVFNSI